MCRDFSGYPYGPWTIRDFMNTNHNKEVGIIIPKNLFEKKPFVFVELPPHEQK